MAASTLVIAGVPLDELRCLAHLVRGDRALLALNGLRQRYGRTSNTPYGVATTLRTVAEYCCTLKDEIHKVQEEDVDSLGRLCKKLLVKRRGLTQKNRNRLLPFQDPDTRDSFLLLPEKLMRSAAKDGRNPYHAACIAKMAVALEISQMAPLRAANLAGLEMGRHLIFVGHGRNEYAIISIPEEEVKNEIALEYPLPRESTKLLRLYIDTYLPKLCPAGTRYLFPGRGNKAIAAATLSTQVEHVIRDSLGHRVNLHLLRHFAAMIYLQAYPGAYEAVRRILGHATASAALDYYVGFETAAAVRHFDEVVLRHRRLAEARARPVNRRGRGK
jgi:integrase